MASKKAEVEVAAIEFGEYKGHPLVILGGDLRFPFQFGVGKAKLLLTTMEAMGVEEFKKALSLFVEKATKDAKE